MSDWPAPAKLNLFLHVLARRADGYHDLQTVFQLIDLCDVISINVRTDGRIERPQAAPIAHEEDLVVRAARSLQAASGTSLGATLHVTKRIPVGAGLGGGSSDAATTLVALNALWDCGISRAGLCDLGLALGSDVPVFIQGRSAWAEGRGERLQPLELPEKAYVVIYPGRAVATHDVFQSAELTRNSPLITMPDFFASAGRNDCEPVVRRLEPEVGAALDWLGHFAPARLTGTGSCIFAACASIAAAEALAARVPDRWTSFVARGLNESPLLACVRALTAA
jgi:4-diphosphocytidyl-2-C-methyl-D-erythritol kinase